MNKRKKRKIRKKAFNFLLGISQLGLFLAIVLFLIGVFGGNISGFWFKFMSVAFYVGILELLNIGWMILLALLSPILEN